MRKSSIIPSGAGVAISRGEDSIYDDIKEIIENLNIIKDVNSIDYQALLDSLNEAKDFTGITVVSGTPASFDPVTKVITIPTVKGDIGEQGAKGLTGLTPIIELTYNPYTGDIDYTTAGYEAIDGTRIDVSEEV